MDRVSPLETLISTNHIELVESYLERHPTVRLPTIYYPCYYGLGQDDHSKRIKIVRFLLETCAERYGLNISSPIANRSLSNFMLTEPNYEINFIFLFDTFIQTGASLWKILRKLARYHKFLTYGEASAIKKHLEKAEKNQNACRKAVITLLGCCGCWRRAQNGQLRDVALAMAQHVWNQRRKRWRV